MDNDDIIPLSPELMDMLMNYDQFWCNTCGQGCSVPTGETPESCRKCGGTTFTNIDDVPH